MNTREMDRVTLEKITRNFATLTSAGARVAAVALVRAIVARYGCKTVAATRALLNETQH